MQYFHPGRRAALRIYGALLLVAGAHLMAPATGRAADAPQMVGDTLLTGDKFLTVADGYVLEGHASVKSPDISIEAGYMKVTVKAGDISRVDARSKVTIKAKIGKKTKVPANIEATSDTAVLNPAQRSLELTGHVQGWVEMAGRGRNLVNGESVVLRRDGEQNLAVKVSGGVRVEIMPEELGRPLAIGKVVITAREANFTNQAGPSRFSGEARAVSTDGPNKFDITATEFVITRNADNAVESLKTVGRTTLKLDAPPQAAGNEPAPVKAASNDKGDIATPTHVEVAADSVILTGATRTINVDGNLKGFYRIPTGTTTVDYPFEGQHLVARYITAEEATDKLPRGLDLQVIGNVQFWGPGLNFD